MIISPALLHNEPKWWASTAGHLPTQQLLAGQGVPAQALCKLPHVRAASAVRCLPQQHFQDPPLFLEVAWASLAALFACSSFALRWQNIHTPVQNCSCRRSSHKQPWNLAHAVSGGRGASPLSPHRTRVSTGRASAVVGSHAQRPQGPAPALLQPQRAAGSGVRRWPTVQVRPRVAWASSTATPCACTAAYLPATTSNPTLTVLHGVRPLVVMAGATSRSPAATIGRAPARRQQTLRSGAARSMGRTPTASTSHLRASGRAIPTGTCSWGLLR